MYKEEILDNPERFADATFQTSEEFLMDTEIIHIAIAKGSFIVLYNMIFDCCESGCYILRLGGSRAVTRI